jgi:nucleotidyltransferase/DNA polymerase involved in DNA repair
MSLSIVPPVSSNNVIPFVGARGKIVSTPAPRELDADLLRLNGGEFPKREKGLRLVDLQENAAAYAGGRFFCLHIPHFSAWVALQADSSLKNVPFAVHDGEVVLAASPMARRAGVETGQSIEVAEVRCPRLRLLRTNPRREAVAWQEVVREIALLTPHVECVEPGFLMADASKVAPARLATLTERWGVPSGMAHDRATAHLAALSGEPGKVRYVEPGHEHEFARTAPVTLFGVCGLSKEALDRMAWFGWNHIESLRALSLTQLREQFGADGVALWRYAQAGKAPENIRPVDIFEGPATIEARRRFPAGLRTAEERTNALFVLLSDALEDAGENRAQILEVVVETTLGGGRSRRVLRDPAAAWGTGALRDLEAVAQELLCEALGGTRGLAPDITALEVRLSGFYGELTGKASAKRRVAGRQAPSTLAA